MNEKRIKDYDSKIRSYIHALDKQEIGKELKNDSMTRKTHAVRDALQNTLNRPVSPRTEKKKVNGGQIVSYASLDPILSTYNTVMAEKDDHINQIEADVERLTGIMETLMEENSKLLENQKNVKNNFKDFVHKSGRLIRKRA